MSHAATKWAFDQPAAFPDMKPAELCVLLALADCHNPAQGCFPSQEYIQKVTNLRERSVRDHLGSLRERGLINWVEMRKDGHRDNNRYSLGFERDFLPANSAGSPTGENEGGNRQESAKPTGNSVPVHTEETVRGTVNRTVEREARTREAAEDAPESGEHLPHAYLVDGLRREATTTVADSQAEVEAEWRKLSPAERRDAAARYGEWVAACRKAGRTKIAGLATYLREKRWEALPAKAAVAETASRVVSPFSRTWWWLFVQLAIRAAPMCLSPVAAYARDARFSVRRRADSAQSRIGWALEQGVDRAALDAAAEAGLQQVPADGEAAKAWDAWFSTLGLRLPTPDAVHWIFLPPTGPPGSEGGAEGEDAAAVVEGLGE